MNFKKNKTIFNNGKNYDGWSDSVKVLDKQWYKLMNVNTGHPERHLLVSVNNKDNYMDLTFNGTEWHYWTVTENVEQIILNLLYHSLPVQNQPQTRAESLVIENLFCCKILLLKLLRVVLIGMQLCSLQILHCTVWSHTLIR